jgi:hypothetical protein
MNTDFIEVYDNALSSKQCKEIIEYINKQELIHGTYGRGLVKEFWNVPDMDLSKILSVNVYLNRSLKECVGKYLTIHPQIKRLSEWRPDKNYNLQKYDVGQSFSQIHCENDGHRLNRMMVWMFYLNTVSDGGGTYFENYDRTLNAVEGRCVIWPAYWTHFHKGIVSNTQSKYIATGWFEFV